MSCVAYYRHGLFFVTFPLLRIFANSFPASCPVRLPVSAFRFPVFGHAFAPLRSLRSLRLNHFGCTFAFPQPPTHLYATYKKS